MTSFFAGSLGTPVSTGPPTSNANLQIGGGFGFTGTPSSNANNLSIPGIGQTGGYASTYMYDVDTLAPMIRSFVTYVPPTSKAETSIIAESIARLRSCVPVFVYHPQRADETASRANTLCIVDWIAVNEILKSLGVSDSNVFRNMFSFLGIVAENVIMQAVSYGAKSRTVNVVVGQRARVSSIFGPAESSYRVGFHLNTETEDTSSPLQLYPCYEEEWNFDDVVIHVGMIGHVPASAYAINITYSDKKSRKGEYEKRVKSGIRVPETEVFVK